MVSRSMMFTQFPEVRDGEQDQGAVDGWRYPRVALILSQKVRRLARGSNTLKVIVRKPPTINAFGTTARERRRLQPPLLKPGSWLHGPLNFRFPAAYQVPFRVGTLHSLRSRV